MLHPQSPGAGSALVQMRRRSSCPGTSARSWARPLRVVTHPDAKDPSNMWVNMTLYGSASMNETQLGAMAEIVQSTFGATLLRDVHVTRVFRPAGSAEALVAEFVVAGVAIDDRSKVERRVADQSLLDEMADQLSDEAFPGKFVATVQVQPLRTADEGAGPTSRESSAFLPTQVDEEGHHFSMTMLYFLLASAAVALSVATCACVGATTGLRRRSAPDVKSKPTLDVVDKQAVTGVALDAVEASESEDPDVFTV